jgi:hypothetical protein
MGKDMRAFAVGLLLFVGMSIAYLAITPGIQQPTLLPGPALVVIYGAPLLSGLVCGLLAARRPIVTLLALGVAAAACFTALDLASAQFGHHLDLGLGGISPTGWIAGVSLLTMPLLVIVGGLLGISLRGPGTEPKVREPKVDGASDEQASRK